MDHMCTFWPLDLVAAGAPPCIGGATPRSLEMGVSKELTSLLPMNYRILQFLQINSKSGALIPCRSQEKNSWWKEFLVFSIESSCMYIQEG